MIRIKICCIASRAEVSLAVREGANFLGLVSWMPTGQGVISDDKIRELARIIPSDVRSVLLTCKRDPDEIVRQVRAAGTDTLQLVDRMEIAHLRQLRRELPEVDLIQVVHVEGQSAISEAQSVASDVDYLLLDSGKPDSSRRELGGTGRVHDWSVSAEIVRRVSVPVFLAGGLGPDNVSKAIQQVHPHGVDVCSRIRLEGQLDETLLTRFVQEVAAAEAN